ncbi:MAG TPA: adenylosuccinate synthase [Dehalococcoidia bacterium]|nr:adenylosuccinate synthase [Chloroflexota bacterium]MQF94902.1 adenylosuccinate synthase [SAR202 cluster bacterium]HAA95248.1 adenylosuccinate synthase [Dehalococcoidia bacterium]HCL25545.1 adenylosuccinate synthase [Dehalococcoidia bacterium]|tara:strand:- start:4325 stop:5611 length:1287 start_codon:yes stop_codon:yes gene_type:complete
MPAYAVIGGQWGDEGKGKVIDYLAGDVDSVVRYAGGNNAGHTVVNEKGTFQLHLVPSGICWPDAYGIIGNGVVVDPDVLVHELTEISGRGIDTSRLYISERAHVIMPYHVVLDRYEEEARGAAAIGTTGRGIGPAYMDKTGRIGVRVGDLLDWDALVPMVTKILEHKNAIITKIYGGEALALTDVLDKCKLWAEQLKPFAQPTEQLIQDLLAQNKRVLLEGAQGTLLDIDHGSYPYVTSSSPSIGGACTGLGLNPQAISGVLGVFKAYSTRVGGGPMPSELHDGEGEAIREKAQEFGVTTGRARRIGWFDGVAGKYSQLVNGFTGLVLTRLDILDGFKSVKVCVAYEVNGERLDRFPANTGLLAQCEPVFEELPGWDEPTASVTELSQLPKNALAYVRRIEELVGCRAQIISTGPRRDETIQVEPVFV